MALKGNVVSDQVLEDVFSDLSFPKGQDFADLVASKQNVLDGGPQFAGIIQERTPVGTDGGDLPSGQEVIRELTTTLDKRGDFTLQNNGVLLTPGEYVLEAWANCSGVGHTRLTLKNATTGNNISYQGGYAPNSDENTTLRVIGRVIVNNEDGELVQLSQTAETTVNSVGRGHGGLDTGNADEYEVHAELRIRQVGKLQGVASSIFNNTLEVDFDGINDELTASNPIESFAWNKPFSLSFDLFRSAGSLIMSMGDSAHSGGAGLTVTRGLLGVIGIGVRLSNGTDYLQVYTGWYGNNDRKHMAITYDGSGATGGLKVYLDGVDVQDINSIDQPPSQSGSGFSSGDFSSGDPWRIGMGPAGELVGRIDQLVMWDKALTTTEVNALRAFPNINEMNEPSLPVPSDALGWWPMGEGDIYPKVYDATSPSLTGNNFTMLGMTVGNFVARP